MAPQKKGIRNLRKKNNLAKIRLVVNRSHDHSMDQAEFTFSQNGQSGFVTWRKACDDQTRHSRLESGLPLNQRVMLKLRDFDEVFRGWLMVSARPSKSGERRYQLANLNFDFEIVEVEFCLAASPEDHA